MGRVIWFTGQSGAGKTTVAREIHKRWDCVMLDGDEMRASVSLGAGFSREDRKEHNLRVARLAVVMSQYTNVLVTVIAPMEEVRKEITEICHPEWVYIHRTMPEREGHFYEEPSGADIVLRVDHDVLGVQDSVRVICDTLGISKKGKYSLFIGRWQPLHDGHLTLFDQVRKEGKQILIGIRDTEKSESNPYSVQERIEMIKAAVPDAEVVVIPDIEEVVYGRGVGYGIREIRLSEDIESISATKIRKGEL
jgi:adenylylsulfate kinase